MRLRINVPDVEVVTMQGTQGETKTLWRLLAGPCWGGFVLTCARAAEVQTKSQVVPYTDGVDVLADVYELWFEAEVGRSRSPSPQDEEGRGGDRQAEEEKTGLPLFWVARSGWCVH
jgi:hypothetical protein